MTTEFEERMKELHKEFENLSPEERKVKTLILFIFCLTALRSSGLKFSNSLWSSFDLLRMETKRAQLSLDGESQELSELEDRIINKKREFLKLLLLTSWNNFLLP
jgi:hypothetical protein